MIRLFESRDREEEEDPVEYPSGTVGFQGPGAMLQEEVRDSVGGDEPRVLGKDLQVEDGCEAGVYFSPDPSPDDLHNEVDDARGIWYDLLLKRVEHGGEEAVVGHQRINGKHDLDVFLLRLDKFLFFE